MAAPACGSCGSPVQDARLCQGCTRELAQALILAASIAEDLDDAVAKLLKRGSGGRSSSPEPPLPVDLAASDVAASLRAELYHWLVTVDPVGSMGAPWETRPLAVMLLARIGTVRQHEHAGEARRGILAAVRAAVTMVDRQPERAPAGLCEACGATLTAELGSDTVQCSCGLLTAGLNERRRQRAEAADVLGTPQELSAVMASIGVTVKASTISSWGTRGRIEKRPGGYYRLSDALAMAAKVRG